MVYDQIFVVLSDCLIFTKSGSREQKNIADFMPDYNLWYALKFSGAKKITIIGDKDISRSPISDYIFTELEFISTWLTQMTKIPCNSGYSYHGNWKLHYGYESDPDLIDFMRKPGKILFIDRNSEVNQGYIKTKSGIEYIKKDDFIKLYNKNPKVYSRTYV